MHTHSHTCTLTPLQHTNNFHERSPNSACLEMRLHIRPPVSIARAAPSMPPLLLALLLVSATCIFCAPTNSTNGGGGGGSFRIQLRQRPMTPELIGLLQECYLETAGHSGGHNNSLPPPRPMNIDQSGKEDERANPWPHKRNKVCHAALATTAFMPFSGPIQIGEPPQVFEALFDTGSAILWVPDSRCQLNGVPWYRSKHAKFVSEKSRTYRRGMRERFSLTYANDLRFDGWWAMDTVSLADARDASRSLTLENQYLGVVGRIVGPNPDHQLGFGAMVGLSFPTHRDKDTLLESLYWSRLVEEQVFSFHIQKMAGKNRFQVPSGELIFGHIDQSLFTGNITWTPVVRPPFWEIRVHSVRLLAANEPRAGPGTPAAVACAFGCHAAVDTGTGLIVGPAAEVEALNEQLGLGRFERLPGIYMAPGVCDLYRKPGTSLVLDIGGTHLELDSQTYLQDIEAQPGTRMCLSILRSLEAEPTNWILGAPFVSSFYSIFDYGNKRMGFAKPK